MSKRRKQGAPRGDRAARLARQAERDAARVRDIFVARPFDGLSDEADWVALRELVPAATSPLRLADDLTRQYGERDVTLSTVLPMAWPALTKPDGRIFVGLQRTTQSGDLSRDLALALLLALETEPGQAVAVPALPGSGPRLQDILDPAARLGVDVQANFDFWLDEKATDPEVKGSLERANASVFPTVKLTSAPAAYWCQFPGKAHVRWVLPDAQDAALTALARLAARSALSLGENTKFAGMFRAHGLLVPVWDLPRDIDARAWDAPVSEFAGRYAQALAADTDLGSAERRARDGLLTRQVTLR